MASAIHWRSGFRRLGSALTWGYWGIAVVILGNQAYEAMSPMNPVTYERSLHWGLYPAGLLAFGESLGVALMIFAPLWAIAAGIGWVARGFADGDAAA